MKQKIIKKDKKKIKNKTIHQSKNVILKEKL